MDTVCEPKSKIHQGLNIRRIRTASHMKQEIFAEKMGIAQQTVSKYENQEVVDEEVLKRCADVLGVPVEVLKYLPADDSVPAQLFKDVTFSNTNTPTDTATNTNHNNTVGQEQTNNTTNYYNSPETLAILKETVDMLKAELKTLWEENSKLRGQK